jgi:hypothetical protein
MSGTAITINSLDFAAPTARLARSASDASSIRSRGDRCRVAAGNRGFAQAWWTIGDQEQTSSCVGWASTDGVARIPFVKGKGLPKTEMLSPRYTWMASKETDTLVSRPETFIEEAGTMLKAAMDILRNYGAVPETFRPSMSQQRCQRP